jgi:hypothetical protein
VKKFRRGRCMGRPNPFDTNVPVIAWKAGCGKRHLVRPSEG